MPFTKFTNLDFDQIKTSIKDYLRANSNFTDFDFEGSNFSILIDTLAYNTYITAFNSNMIVNESFLDSATLRENVVSLARNIGYVPRSRQCSQARISFSIETESNTPTVSLQAGLVCVGSSDNTSYIFSVPSNVSENVVNGVATFSDLTIYQGTFLTKQFVVDGSLDQRFILDNPFIDTSTISVYVKGISDTGLGVKYSVVDNIIKVDSESEIYLIQEIKDEKYEIIFGDGYFGKKLENNAVITVHYIVTDGKDGNGSRSFSFAGTFNNASGVPIIPQNTITVTTLSSSANGSDIEPINSIKYFAPRLYSAQYRAVTARDYEAIIQNKIYPNTESISVVGGEELDPPEYGTVVISIKPKNGTYVSDFDKAQILSKLKQYTLSGINQRIVDLKILYVEIDSAVYYNSSKLSSVESIKEKISSSLTKYAGSVDLNKFGGRFKYSKVQQIIDNTDTSIVSNITKVRMRRDLKVLINRQAQYEICFGNKFHAKPGGYNIKSTGFRVINDPNTVYLTDIPNSDNKTGTISVVRLPSSTIGVTTSLTKPEVVIKSAGTVNYETGEILLNTITIISTEISNDIIEIQAFPESNDIIGLKDLYVSFDVSKSQINMVKDVISSGEDISGVVFSRDSYRSSYSNGELIRKVIK
jgi:hypothetical protein